MIGKYSNGKNRLCPDPKVVTAKTIPYGPWMRAPIETRRPLPSQRWGVVYWHPTIVGDSTITWPKQPLPNLSNAPQQVHNSGIGISEKEHDVLAEIADELGVDSLMFAGSTVGSFDPGALPTLVNSFALSNVMHAPRFDHMTHDMQCSIVAHIEQFTILHCWRRLMYRLLCDSEAHIKLTPSSIPSPNDGNKVDNVEDVVRSHKKSRNEKHRPFSSAKCSRSGNDLVDATKDKPMNLEMAEAAEQPCPKH
ncbi:hypothetical protein V6N12_019981 [Hibiscus sabdariffa]